MFLLHWKGPNLGSKNFRSLGNVRMGTLVDTKFRTALTNMRYAACRWAFSDARFWSVPIITSWNSQKDKINELGGSRYADDTRQELVHFYSNDTLSPHADSNDRIVPKLCGKVKLGAQSTLSLEEKTALWNAHPCTSEGVAGKLSLCLGMPVMIRNNDATDERIEIGASLKLLSRSSTNQPKSKAL
ncbi:hypothetical protein B0H10DRAFT_1857630 [Mycena sp. CBHHK59/15]|nr:hypothetical protein B0H10DRAFT_1857630 [Mycena sp. CBHHK59/15]